MPRTRLWDVFCQVVDNHGDLGVCWRLARQLGANGQRVRLWVDDAAALAWMAPGALNGPLQGIEILPWRRAGESDALRALEPADVWIEAFGCHLPEPFVAFGVDSRKPPPLWINLEYLSAEPRVERNHGLHSPVMSGPAKGWTKRFFYPGFTPDTGGLLREADLFARQQAFDRPSWRGARAGQTKGRLVSLFCYEPATLLQLLHQLQRSGDRLLVTPGRPFAALNEALSRIQPGLDWTALPYTDQDGFDEMLWACDLNFVRGEDSWVRALWAGRPFVWQIYPQHDRAHHAKLEAFLDWLDAPVSLRRFHRVWNAVTPGALPVLDTAMLRSWAECVQAARARLLAQSDLLTRLLAF